MTGPNGSTEVRALGGPIAAFTVGAAGAARMDDGKPGGWAATTTKEGFRYRVGSPRPLEHLGGGDGDVAISTPPQPADPPGTPTTAEGYARLVLAGEMHIDTAAREWRAQTGQTAPPAGWPLRARFGVDRSSRWAQRAGRAVKMPDSSGSRPWIAEKYARRREEDKARLIAGAVVGETMEEAAKRIGVGVRAINKWMLADPEFGERLHAARGGSQFGKRNHGK